MLEKIKNNDNITLIFAETLLIYLVFWFLLKNVNTDGVWETVIASLVFFLAFPIFILRVNFKEKLQKNKLNLTTLIQIILFLIIVLFIILRLDGISFLKLNYLSRANWFLNDWWIIFFIDLFLIPVILISQEFFFRGVLAEAISKKSSLFLTLTIQAVLFVCFEVLFFEIFNWQFIVFDFILAFFLGFIYLQNKTIWYSFAVRWFLILFLDGLILYKIQNIKS